MDSNQIKWLISVMQINTHDGVAGHGFLTSLLQGIMWAQKNKCFETHDIQILWLVNWLMDQDSWSWRVEASGSSCAGSSSSVVWKLGDDQSIPVKAWNTASSSISVDGSISGAKVCLRVGGIRSWAS